MAALSAEAAQLKEDGNKAFGDKLYEKAIELYSRALEVAPRNAVLHSNLAAAHLGLQQWDKALSHADECIKADPGFVKGYGRKAAAQMGNIRPGDAERTLVAALKLHPNSVYLKEELQRVRQDDGDQRPVRSRDGSDRALRDLQARTGLEMSPFTPWPSEAFKAAYMGSESVFVQHFQPRDLLLRAMEARLPLVIVIVAGAQRIRGMGAASNKSGTVSDAERGSQHGAVLRRVLEAGARVDAKDAAGWTALHHALAHHVAMDLAKMLLEAGADVNAQDRYGTYPLISAVMTGEMGSIRLLLDHGARCDLKDNDGYDALKLCKFNPAVEALLHSAHFLGKKPGDSKACGNCGKADAGKACGGCGVVYYCSRDCQRAAWPAHKSTCKAAGAAGPSQPAQAAAANGSAQGSAGGSGTSGGSADSSGVLRVPVLMAPQALTVKNLSAHLTPAMTSLSGTKPHEAPPVPQASVMEIPPEEVRAMLKRKSKVATKGKALCVKVQVVAEKPPAAIAAVMRRMGEFPEAMLCYDKDRSLVFQLDGATPAGQQLDAIIRKNGVRKLKGYFAVYFDQDCIGKDGVPKEVIVQKAMLPPQPF